jgi:hypothetical protein
MPKETDESADSERPNKPIFQSWTPGDIKLLIITIAGTVAANIITVIIVALAIIVARSFRPNPGTPSNYIFLLGISAFPALAAYAAFSSLYRTKRERTASLLDKARKWAMIVSGLGAGFLTLLYILGWIGFAVGVK